MGNIATHGGNLRRLAHEAGVAESDILDFSANINPLGPPEWLRRVVSMSVERLVHYPDPDCSRLLAAASERYHVSPDEVVAGNGSSELLYAALSTLAPRRALVPVPSYVDYTRAAARAGATVEQLPLHEDNGFTLDLTSLDPMLRADDVVILGQPNNPTGKSIDAAELRALALQHPASWFLVDEAFADFVDGLDRLTGSRPPNVIVLLSLTKNYAIPGLRLGLALCDQRLAARIREALPPWTVNSISQAVGEQALLDGEYLERTRLQVRRWREQLIEWLGSVPGLHVFPGEANFLLVRMRGSAADLAPRLLQRGIAIRVCSNFSNLDERYFRIAVRTEEENACLCQALGTELGGAPAIIPKRRTPAIMFQGTTSNAGKSVLTAALCRILLEDGIRVAPFKAQNMSLNSFVTRDGLEMGRAQVVQAQACRLDPDVRMNPVLLKPNSDTGSQIIVRGRPIGNMDAGTYFRHKAEAFEQVRHCYDDLAREYDAIVLEGAGSPGEVNLKAHDIVNMRMAEYARAPVLLVGDIDRGGVFASFVGCMEVFTEPERRRIEGFIVNRFRGQESLLGNAFDYVQSHTGKPVLGVIPYLRDLGLPEEDSVSFKEARPENPDTADRVDIALIDLPHISNFTDVDALRIEPDVQVRVVRTASELGCPAALILPGSKNVPGDMRFLRETGLAQAILALDRTEIVGICGGFQMLGQRIEDPHRLESDGTAQSGLGMLPLVTTLDREKTLTRARATHIESGLDVVGYEIHHGQTQCGAAMPVLQTPTGAAAGARSPDGRIWGCYLHGLFDEDQFRRWFIDRLRVQSGREALRDVQATYDLEPALNRLAATVRSRLPIDSIYKAMGLR